MDASTSVNAIPLPEQLLSPPPPPSTITSAYPEAAAAGRGNEWQGSGSIGPFFAVISVLVVLAVISCVLGRKASPEHGLSLKHEIEYGNSWYGRVWRRCRRCVGSGGTTNKGGAMVDVASLESKGDGSSKECAPHEAA